MENINIENINIESILIGFVTFPIVYWLIGAIFAKMCKDVEKLTNVTIEDD